MTVIGINGRPITRLDSIKQSIILFMNAKLTINPDHRFAFALIGRSTTTWLRKEFNADMRSAFDALRSITGDANGGRLDLTQLFRIAAYEGIKSRALNRSLRVEPCLIKHIYSRRPPTSHNSVEPYNKKPQRLERSILYRFWYAELLRICFFVMAEEEPVGAEEVEKTVQSEAADGSSEDWKARLKLPLVDTRYTTELCEGDLHTIIQMGFAQNTAHQSLLGSNQALVMKSEF